VSRSWTRVTGAVVAGVSLVAAGCGGGDGDSLANTGTVDEGVKSGIEDALGSGSAAEAKPHPTSMEDWEKLWEEERAAVVARLKDAGAGKSADGATANGLAGFTIDLSKCPAGWSDTEGITDTEIRMGYTTAQSGTLADYGNIGRARDLLAAEANAKGGFKDSTGKSRKLTIVTKDDGYDPARTIPLVDELIDSEKVFAQITLGSAPTMKVYDKLNQRCIPNPFAETGHPAWGDPVNHPWTTGMQLAYNTEAVMWGAFIEKRIDEMAPNGGKATIAALVMNNDFGKAYDAGFKDYLAQSAIRDRIEYVTETIEPQAPTITDPMTTLAAKNPDMFIAMVAGTPCTQTITEAANNGMKEDVEYLFQPSVCSASTFIGKDKVGGDYADGWWIVNGGIKDLNSPAFDDDAYVQYGRKLLKDNGLDPKASGSYGSGLAFGWPLMQVLHIAGELEGGLTRSNFMIAMRAVEMTHPFLLEGIRFNTEGNDDAFFIEGGVYQTRDAAAETWNDEGSVIDLSGKSRNCAWNQSTGLCG
jgi:branched-chain amino acid transport system substrate-binding protein